MTKKYSVNVFFMFLLKRNKVIYYFKVQCIFSYNTPRKKKKNTTTHSEFETDAIVLLISTFTAPQAKRKVRLICGLAGLSPMSVHIFSEKKKKCPVN
jgi:hypothetical protein